MVNEQAEGAVKLKGLRIFRWTDNLARYVVDPNDALFIIRITTTKHDTQDEIKHPPLVIDFEIEHLHFVYDLAFQVISMTNFFSFETVVQLAQQVTDYIDACISFHHLKCVKDCCRGAYRCDKFSFSQPRHVFIADIVHGDHIKEPQGNGETRSYLSSGSAVKREFITACSDFTRCLEANVHNTKEFSDVDNILRSWMTHRLTGKNLASESSHKKRKLNEHQPKNLCLHLQKVKPTMEIIDQVSEHVEDDNDCSICFRSLSEKTQTVKMVRCKHEFHSHCIFKWLTINQSCPNCRTSSLLSVYL